MPSIELMQKKPYLLDDSEVLTKKMGNLKGLLPEVDLNDYLITAASISDFLNNNIYSNQLFDGIKKSYFDLSTYNEEILGNLIQFLKEVASGEPVEIQYLEKEEQMAIQQAILSKFNDVELSELIISFTELYQYTEDKLVEFASNLIYDENHEERFNFIPSDSDIKSYLKTLKIDPIEFNKLFYKPISMLIDKNEEFTYADMYKNLIFGENHTLFDIKQENVILDVKANNVRYFVYKDFSILKTVNNKFQSVDYSTHYLDVYKITLFNTLNKYKKNEKEIKEIIFHLDGINEEYPTRFYSSLGEDELIHNLERMNTIISSLKGTNVLKNFMEELNLRNKVFTIEEISDFLENSFIKFEKRQIVRNNCKKHYDLLTDNVLQVCTELLEEKIIDEDGIKNNIFSKAIAFKNKYKNKKELIKKFEDYVVKIKEDNKLKVEFLYKRIKKSNANTWLNNGEMASIFTEGKYETFKELGSPFWCITRDERYFNQYVNKNSIQFIYSNDDLGGQIEGFTFSLKYWEVTAAHDYKDSPIYRTGKFIPIVLKSIGYIFRQLSNEERAEFALSFEDNKKRFISNYGISVYEINEATEILRRLISPRDIEKIKQKREEARAREQHILNTILNKEEMANDYPYFERVFENHESGLSSSRS